QELGTLGFECSLEEVDLEDITENQINTIKACTAEDPGVKQRETGRKFSTSAPRSQQFPLSQGKCLQGISEDLRAYRAQLRSLNDPRVLATLDGMMEVRIP
ncbi:IL12A protein, partial [Gymnorhina tibicen]|nr:IL12A protein [Gymnorhina tibicen]